MNQYIIGGENNPFRPKGWAIVEHRKDGWSPCNSNHALYLSCGQKGNNVSNGNQLREELAGLAVLNANTLDYFLSNPDRIPTSWKMDEKGRHWWVCFWGTIYRLYDGGLCVRCLCWGTYGWCWSSCRIGLSFSGQYPAAVLAS